ncbi:MAG: GIY-YIG nuclease family protein, partial [Chlorobi bacterium]|nr:GIY-YIG nuclease family protein [Chlorobiota bacterium]
PTGKYYIGQTSDIEGRIKRHNAGYEKFTKQYMPWKIISYIEVLSRKEAMRIEKYIKSKKKRENQLKYFKENKSSGSEK